MNILKTGDNFVHELEHESEFDLNIERWSIYGPEEQMFT